MSAAIAANQHTPSGALVTASNLCSVPHNSEGLPGRNRWESSKIHGACAIPHRCTSLSGLLKCLVHMVLISE